MTVVDGEQKMVCREDLCTFCGDRHFGTEMLACPYCGSRFPRNGKQRYCTPHCTTKAGEERRAEYKCTYMRLYQRARRARMKAAVRV